MDTARTKIPKRCLNLGRAESPAQGTKKSTDTWLSSRTSRESGGGGIKEALVRGTAKSQFCIFAFFGAGVMAQIATSLEHTFSAFWLRSSVVSVLISLISDTLGNA